jgi:death-on-curing protein
MSCLDFILIESGCDLNASQTDKYNFIIEISKGNLDFESIKEWIVRNARQI